MVGGGALRVGGGNVCGDWGVLALVMDFREVMLTSPPELAHGDKWGMLKMTFTTYPKLFIGV